MRIKKTGKSRSWSLPLVVLPAANGAANITSSWLANNGTLLRRRKRHHSRRAKNKCPASVRTAETKCRSVLFSTQLKAGWLDDVNQHEGSAKKETQNR
jgi:hypothetical protein